MSQQVIDCLENLLDALANINSEWCEFEFPLPHKQAQKMADQLNAMRYDVYTEKFNDELTTIRFSKQTM